MKSNTGTNTAKWRDKVGEWAVHLRTHLGILRRDLVYKLLSAKPLTKFANENSPVPLRALLDIEFGCGCIRVVLQLLHIVSVDMEAMQHRRRSGIFHRLVGGWLRGRFTFGVWGILLLVRSSPVRLWVRRMCRDDGNLLLWLPGSEGEWIWVLKTLLHQECGSGWVEVESFRSEVVGVPLEQRPIGHRHKFSREGSKPLIH